uniref:Uncharacterized protein n=1 Tax=Aegilops tauschii subsp. strangulata TaxID=200361 RepID=A0A453I9J1_AEGTS
QALLKLRRKCAAIMNVNGRNGRRTEQGRGLTEKDFEKWLSANLGSKTPANLALIRRSSLPDRR